LKVPPSGDAAETFFDRLVIYPGMYPSSHKLIVGSKIRHFRELEKTTGIKYEDMVFFDDEVRNAEVEQLGVTFILIGRDGVTKDIFDQSIEEWRRRRKQADS
jgi:magnesium-dependent phosphatase 1